MRQSWNYAPEISKAKQRSEKWQTAFESVDGASQIWCIAVLVRVSLSSSGLSDLPMPLIYMLFCFVIIPRPLAGFVASEFWQL